LYILPKDKKIEVITLVSFDSEKQWKVFPNPMNDLLEIRFSDTQDGILNIFDSTGKLVYKIAVEG